MKKQLKTLSTIWALALITLLLLLHISTAAAQQPGTFRQAKKLMVTMYEQHPISFYCRCPLNKVGKKLVPDLRACGYSSRKPKDRRYQRIEWEHVMPASWLGNQRQCWQHGGRKNCRAKDIAFNIMEAEMVNLVPAIGEVNRDRSNYKFGIIEGEKRQYGQCDFEVDNKHRIAEPKESIRGDIARIMFFMRDKYNIRLSAPQTALYKAWSKQDPIDERERRRNKKILAIQGHSNHYITGQ